MHNIEYEIIIQVSCALKWNFMYYWVCFSFLHALSEVYVLHLQPSQLMTTYEMENR